MFPELNEARKKEFPHESQMKNKINKNSTNLLGKNFFKQNMIEKSIQFEDQQKENEPFLNF